VEELLIVLFQVLVEIVVQFAIYLPFDIPFYRSRTDEHERGCAWMALCLVAGGVLGGLSLLLFPKLVIPYPWLRVVNLFAAPLLAGSLSLATAAWRRKRGFAVIPWPHFWYAFCFALAFSGVRFAYADH
jgi:hypothetical protein